MKGGFPTQADEIAARLKNTPDLMLDAALEREIQVEKILWSKLDFARLKIRLMQQERAERLGAKTPSGYDPS